MAKVNPFYSPFRTVFIWSLPLRLSISRTLSPPFPASFCVHFRLKRGAVVTWSRRGERVCEPERRRHTCAHKYRQFRGTAGARTCVYFKRFLVWISKRNVERGKKDTCSVNNSHRETGGTSRTLGLYVQAITLKETLETEVITCSWTLSNQTVGFPLLNSRVPGKNFWFWESLEISEFQNSTVLSFHILSFEKMIPGTLAICTTFCFFSASKLLDMDFKLRFGLLESPTVSLVSFYQSPRFLFICFPNWPFVFEASVERLAHCQTLLSSRLSNPRNQRRQKVWLGGSEDWIEKELWLRPN